MKILERKIFISRINQVCTAFPSFLYFDQVDTFKPWGGVSFLNAGDKAGLSEPALLFLRR
jgi:hypothetical protein